LREILTSCIVPVGVYGAFTMRLGLILIVRVLGATQQAGAFRLANYDHLAMHDLAPYLLVAPLFVARIGKETSRQLGSGRIAGEATGLGRWEKRRPRNLGPVERVRAPRNSAYPF
jgi:hypothetical protein